jgi:RNA polymerase sigma-70 factor (ECF subfamily)
MWRAVYATTGDREIASDAVAEAFAQALRRGEALNDIAAWVWRVAFIIARAELARRTPDFPDGREPSYQMQIPIPHVFEALSRLPHNQRFAVVLHDYADRPIAEIADVLGTAQATVYVHLSRGRRRLRKELEARDDE